MKSVPRKQAFLLLLTAHITRRRNMLAKNYQSKLSLLSTKSKLKYIEFNTVRYVLVDSPYS